MRTVYVTICMLVVVFVTGCAFKVKTPVPFTNNAVTVGAEVKLTLETEETILPFPGNGEVIIK